MDDTTSTSVAGRRWIRWVLLLALFSISIAVVFIPAWFIQPFKLQTPERLQISYFLHHSSPVITVAVLVIAILIAVSLWKGTRRWWGKTLLVLLFGPLLLTTWFARQNHFEWMFKPLPGPGFSDVNDSAFVADDDMVVAVEINGDAAAYPIRQIAYHHVVQDTIGGTPALVTY